MNSRPNRPRSFIFVGFATIDSIEGKLYPGGAAGAMSINAANLGVKSSLLAPLSQDENGRWYKQELQRAGVDTRLSSQRGAEGDQCLQLIEKKTKEFCLKVS